MAYAIKDGLDVAGENVSVMKTTEAEDIDYFDYNLSVLGARLFSDILPSRLHSFCSKNLTNTKSRKKSR